MHTSLGLAVEDGAAVGARVRSLDPSRDGHSARSTELALPGLRRADR